jgi:hypothetical protein
MAPVASAEALPSALGDAARSNMTFVRHVGLNHGFHDAQGVSHAGDVIRLGIAWLRTSLSAP